MTLVVVGATRHFVVLAADRLVTLMGRSVDPDFDKVVVAETDSVRLAAGFTGLAYGAPAVTGYGFHFVMTETFHRAICAGGGAAQVLEHFRGDLEHQFSRFRVRLEDRGIEVLCVGFDDAKRRPVPFVARVGNGMRGRVGPSFDLDYRTVDVAVEVAGFGKAVRPQDLAKMQAAAAAGRPSTEVGGLAVSVLSHAARHAEGRLYIGREYNLVIVTADASEPIDSRFCARGATVMKHPAFVTPSGIGNQTLVTIPVDPRDRRRRTSDFRAAVQFSPRRCPEGPEREQELTERLDSSARETVQRYLIEHRDTVPPEVRPEEVVTPSSRSWRHVELPTGETKLRDLLRLLLSMDICNHEPELAACVEARRLVAGDRCSECAAWSNTYMEQCASCGSLVCTNLACPDLFGNPTHSLTPVNGRVQHIRPP